MTNINCYPSYFPQTFFEASTDFCVFTVQRVCLFPWVYIFSTVDLPRTWCSVCPLGSPLHTLIIIALLRHFFRGMRTTVSHSTNILFIHFHNFLHFYEYVTAMLNGAVVLEVVFVACPMSNVYFLCVSLKCIYSFEVHCEPLYIIMYTDLGVDATLQTYFQCTMFYFPAVIFCRFELIECDINWTE